MKKLIAFTLLITITLLFAVSCTGAPDTDVLWNNAIYKSDTELGDGERQVFVKVVAGEKSVTFTINTDLTILGDALSEHGLLEGEEGAYGLYVKKVNGITADYDIDASYWGFYKDGEYMMTGVDVTEFTSGEQFELVYTK